MTSSEFAFGDCQDSRQADVGDMGVWLKYDTSEQRATVTKRGHVMKDSNSSANADVTRGSAFGLVNGDCRQPQNVCDYVEHSLNRLFVKKVDRRSNAEKPVTASSSNRSFCGLSNRASLRKRGYAMFIVFLLPMFMRTVMSEGQEDGRNGVREDGALPVSDVDRIVTLSPCRAVIAERVINLEPLQKADGTPRYQTDVGGGWKVTFNPCVSYNLPPDPHSGDGDQCQYVAACKYGLTNSTEDANYYYTLGLQRTALFQTLSAVDVKFNATSPENDDAINPANTEEFARRRTSLSPSGGQSSHYARDSMPSLGTFLVLRGIRSMRHQKMYINLICDYTRTAPNEGLFTVAESPLEGANSNHYFELRHLCCCPDGCPVTTPHAASDMREQRPRLNDDTVNVTSLESNFSMTVKMSQTSDGIDVSNSPTSLPEADQPTQLWLVLVVNGFILITAVVVAAMCCRRGGGLMSTGPYTYIPAVHASHGTINSFEPRAVISALMSPGRVKSVADGMNSSLGGSVILGGATTKTGSADYRDYSVATVVGKLPQLDNCVIPGHALEMGQRLGGGLFCDTYLCQWKHRAVAAKRITVGTHLTQLSPEDLDLITGCVTLLSKQRHANLAAVIGVCFDTKQPYVISEFVEGECLRDVIRRSSPNDPLFTWPQKLQLCIQTADGMAFLHSAKYPILHRDLRSANILVDSNGKAKIVDFGLTRIVQRLRNECERGQHCFCQKELSALPASIRWTAPEILENPSCSEDDVAASGINMTSVLGTAADVYSFAMVLWELATCTDPFGDISDERQVIQLVLDGTRPPVDAIPRGTVQHYKELMKRCWDQAPDMRPQFKQVALYLKTILQVVNKMASQPHRERTDSIHSTTTTYLRSALNIALDT